MIEKGYYRHYKGGIYQVVCTGKHTETEEELVIYQDAKGQTWARPVSMWKETVNGEPRFMHYADQRNGQFDFVMSRNVHRKSNK